ncbi:FtsX-like permease family protein [Chitinophaga sp. S165]|uniref:FtsX-like permease family protein n=1 Tax=Chitinophaga sp. S165 TaxID=2135462 RepID=UPI000D70CBF6|nr:FtsX-like permease family protein [Chitinophaga sp. S165]PWV53802.1 FtsX-like permease family protein [Chitinophaga sp. S165]
MMPSFYQLLKKIIQTGIGKARLFMAAGGLGIAMILLLIAIQAHTDFDQLLHNQRNANESADFLVINKKITNAMMGQNAKSEFTPAEIADLKQQPFTEAFGFITSNQYKVTAAAPGELHFYTDMFFESVPDSFIDVKNDEWKWTPADNTIPIILPNDFLNLYNFGFALSQDLPQISQETVKALPMKVTISQGLITQEFTGRIVGFSDRISSFLVPGSFMDWANSKFGSGQAAAPSRVIIKTKDPSNPLLSKYLEEKGYTTNQDKIKYSKTKLIVQMIVSVIGFFGLVLLAFALVVFSMFIQLVIASCKKEIQLLVTLGTAPRQLQRYLMRQFVPLYITIGIVALLLVAALQWFASAKLATHDMFISQWLSVGTACAALLVIVLVYIVNRSSVSRYINAIS